MYDSERLAEATKRIPQKAWPRKTLPNDEAIFESFSWAEVKQRYIDLANGAPWGSQPTLNRQGYSGPGKSTWQGGTKEDMLGWLRDGYKPPQFLNLDAYTPKIERRRIIVSDEGEELHLDRAWSGDPMPWTEWEMRPATPGMRIEIDFTFNYDTPAKVLADYGAWLAGIMAGLELQGYDLEVEIFCEGMNALVGHYGKTIPGIRVSEIGQFSDFQEFSAMFSPMGFRTLGFISIGMMGDRQKMTVTGGLGSATGNQWKCSWNADEAILSVGSPSSAAKCPIDKLTDQVREFGLLPKKDGEQESVIR